MFFAGYFTIKVYGDFMKIVLSLLSFVLMTTVSYASPIQLKGDAKFSSDAPLEKINGTAQGSGKLELEAKALEKMEGMFKMAVASMRTGNDMRDSHLRGAEWLNADKCPNVTFEFKGAKVLNQKTKGDVTMAAVEVSGDFGLNCKKQKLTTQVELKWKGNLYKAKTAFKIALADYNVAGKKGIVGNKVGKEIAVKVSFKGKGK